MTIAQDPSVRMTIGVLTGRTMAEMGFDDTPENRARWAAEVADVAATQQYGPVAIDPEWPDVAYGDLADSLLDDVFAEHLRAVTNASAPVAKAADSKRFTLGPMYIPWRLDAHEEWTDDDELQGAVWDYVRSGDRRIRLQHNTEVVAGEWLEIMSWPFAVTVPILQPDGSSTLTSFPAGTVFLGVQWAEWAWPLVVAGKIRGYSIGGKAERLLVDLPDER